MNEPIGWPMNNVASAAVLANVGFKLMAHSVRSKSKNCIKPKYCNKEAVKETKERAHAF